MPQLLLKSLQRSFFSRVQLSAGTPKVSFTASTTRWSCASVSSGNMGRETNSWAVVLLSGMIPFCSLVRDKLPEDELERDSARHIRCLCLLKTA